MFTPWEATQYAKVKIVWAVLPGHPRLETTMNTHVRNVITYFIDTVTVSLVCVLCHVCRV